MDNELVLFESQALEPMRQLANLKKEKDRLDELEKSARDQLEKAMAAYNIKSFSNEYVSIVHVAETTSTSLDTKKLQTKEPKLYEELMTDYPKVTNKKAYIKITVK